MQNRDQSLLALRPELGLALADCSEMERFQNETLRPVLKMQHTAMLTFFKAHVKKQFGETLEAMNQLDKHAFIAKTLKSDLVLRNQLIGMVLGQLTSTELDQYLSHTEELRRRLTGLFTQRVQSEY